MAIRTKAIKGSGIVQLRSVRSSSEGSTQTEEQVWTGPYAQLLTKQNSLLGAKATKLEPTEANHGKLTVTLETELTTTETDGRRETFTEVVWQELRKPVETNPYFKEMSEADIVAVKKAIENSEPIPTEGELVAKLYNLLARGTTEWSTGVPVVRRTKTRVSGSLAAGKAWYRDDPPISVEGDWVWLKTADERRRDLLRMRELAGTAGALGVAEAHTFCAILRLDLDEQDGDFGHRLLAAGQHLGVADRVGQRQRAGRHPDPGDRIRHRFP